MAGQESVKVWDLAVRIFHWSLVVAFAIAFITHEDVGDLHIYAGYTVLGLVLLRIVWGFVGTEHARFSDFIYPPARVLAYLKGLVGGKPQDCRGHNPAGGWMVVALLLTLLVVSYTGLQAYGAEGEGPFAGADYSLIATAQAHEKSKHAVDSTGGAASTATGEEHLGEVEGENDGYWHEVHEASSDFALFLIALHILGVIVSSRLHQQNLVRAMVTGRKPRH